MPEIVAPANKLNRRCGRPRAPRTCRPLRGQAIHSNSAPPARPARGGVSVSILGRSSLRPQARCAAKELFRLPR